MGLGNGIPPGKSRDIYTGLFVAQANIADYFAESSRDTRHYLEMVSAQESLNESPKLGEVMERKWGRNVDGVPEAKAAAAQQSPR